jgi:hypothetical protein
VPPVAKKLSRIRRVFTLDNFKEIAMRPAVALLLACLALAACGGTERKTVIVNPPPDSTTVVDRDGNAHVIPNH